MVTELMNALSDNKLSNSDKEPVALVLACSSLCVAGTGCCTTGHPTDQCADLVTIIGSPTLSIYTQVLNATMAVALHPDPKARLAAAHCARCLGDAVPGKASFLANEVSTPDLRL